MKIKEEMKELICFECAMKLGDKQAALLMSQPHRNRVLAGHYVRCERCGKITSIWRDTPRPEGHPMPV